MRKTKFFMLLHLLLSTPSWANPTDLCLRLPGAPLHKTVDCRDYFAWEESSRPNRLLQDFDRLITRNNSAQEKIHFNKMAENQVWSQEDRALIEAANPGIDFSLSTTQIEDIRTKARQLSGWEDIELVVTASPTQPAENKRRWEYSSSVYQTTVYVGDEAQFLRHLQEPHNAWITGNCDKIDLSPALADRLKLSPSATRFQGLGGQCFAAPDRATTENLLRPTTLNGEAELMKFPSDRITNNPPSPQWSEKSTHWWVGIVLASVVAGFALKDKTIVITR